MRVSTTVQFDRASTIMNKLQNDLGTSQAKVSVQKQILNPSEKPDQTATILRLNSVIDRQTTFGRTIEMLQARLDNESATLTSASEVLIRIKELAVQANNGTQGLTSRKIIATEMKGLRDQLLSLANSTDTTGNYIFSGSQVRTPAFVEDATGAVAYKGDQTRMRVDVGEKRKVAINRPGNNVFIRVVRTDNDGTVSGKGFFQAIDDLITGVKTPSTTSNQAMQRGLTEMDALHEGIILAQAASGTDMKVLEQQAIVLGDTKLSLKNVLSKVEDLDMATAMTDMQKQILSLEAAQNSFAKISQLSLFTYIR